MRTWVKAAILMTGVLALAACNTTIPKQFKGQARGKLAKDDGFRMVAPPSCPQIFSDYHSNLGIRGVRRRDPHHGIDFPGAKGTPILAAAPGEVVAVGRTEAGGNAITISHGADDLGNFIYSTYLHLTTMGVHMGQHVARGAVIGTMGSTGANSGRIVHLHFETFVLDNPDLLEASESSFFVKRGTAVALAYYSTVNPHDLMIQSTKYDKPTMARVDEAPAGTGGGGGRFPGFTYPIDCG